MKRYKLNYLTIFVALCIFISIAGAAPFTKHSKELNCIISPNDISYNHHAFPVVHGSITQDMLNGAVWLRRELDSDYIHTSFGSVNSSHLIRDNPLNPGKPITDKIEWNANNELTLVHGHIFTSNKEGPASWKLFRFEYNIHSDNWLITGILKINGIPVLIDTNNAHCNVS